MDTDPFADLDRLAAAVKDAHARVSLAVAARDKEIRRLHKTGRYKPGAIRTAGNVSSSLYATIVKADA